MLMTNFLKLRKSEREYKAKLVGDDLLGQIENILKELEEEDANGNFRLRLYRDGDKVFKELEGKGGYSGVMIESPHYVGLEFLKDNKESKVFGAYYLEKLITALNQMGLASCWISVGEINKDSNKEVFGQVEGIINYFLAFGFAKAKNPFINDPFSSRIGVEDLVFSDELGKLSNQEELERRGLDDLFYYVRFSPSALNKQPWRFLLEKDKVSLLLEYGEGEEPNLIDGGVIMYYFGELGKSIGINDKWKLLDRVEKLEDRNFLVIGEISL